MASTMSETVEDTSTTLQPSDLVERVDSEYECELMIEALKKELSAVRVRIVYRDHSKSLFNLVMICVQNQLAFLTHHLDGETSVQRDHSCPASREGGSDATSRALSKSTNIASTSVGGLSLASRSRVQATEQRNKKVWLTLVMEFLASSPDHSQPPVFQRATFKKLGVAWGRG